MAQGTTKGVPIDIDPLLAADSDLLVPSQKAIKTYTDNGLSNKVNRSGDTMSGSLILFANPTIALEAATKDYVDTLINGIDWKQSANAATVAALPAYTVSGSGQILTGNVNGAIPSATTDGVTLTANQRLLVKNETLALTPNNGIYVVTQVGNGSLPFILTRSSDANTSALLAEATLSVSGGSTLSNTQWHCNPATIPLVIGTTYITFAQIGSGTYTFSPPLVNTGNIISIPLATSSVNGYLSSTDWSTFNNKVTSLSAGTGISIGGTVTVPTVTNTAPDQTVVLSNGTGISVTGTYPNFTIASTITGTKFFSKVTADNSVTGTLTRTVLATVLIPANTISVGDTIYIQIRTKRTGANAAFTPWVQINTSATVGGSTIFLQTQAVANNAFFTNKLGIVKSATSTEFGSSGTVDDTGQGAVNVAAASYNIDWTQNQHIVCSIALGNIADTATWSLLFVEVK